MGITKEQREEWKRIGLCSHCGKNIAADGKFTCQRCLDINKAARDYKRSHNLCVKCGKNKVAPSRKYCDECLEQRRDKYEKDKKNQEYITAVKLRDKKRREKCKNNFLCVQCGKPVFENHTLCYEHLTSMRNRARRDRALAKEYNGE